MPTGEPRILRYGTGNCTEEAEPGPAELSVKAMPLYNHVAGMQGMRPKTVV